MIRGFGARSLALATSVALTAGTAGIGAPGAALASADATAAFTGAPAEWAAIDHETASSAGTLQLLKTVQKDGKLYALIEGAGIGAQGELYIDADNDAATGQAVPYWSNATGIDYKVVGASLLRNESGAWVAAGTVERGATAGIAEIAIGLGQLGLDGAGTAVRVAYGQATDNSYLPDPGKAMLDTPAAASAYGPDPTLAIDADATDWAGIDPLAQSEDGRTKLYAAENNEALSVLVTGPMGDWNDIYIDVDHNKATGFNTNWLWADYGFDFLFENGSLFSNVGGGFSWNPLTTAGLQYAASGTNDDKIIEMSVPLAGLGLTAAAPLYVGFSGAERYTPKAAGEPAKVVPSLPRISVDGNGADWTGVAPLGTGTSNAETMSAFVKDDTLYVLAQGADLSGEKNLFLNTDNDPTTGHQGWQYARTGADYLVQNGAAYRSTGAGWSWDSAPDVTVSSVVSSVYAPAGKQLLEMAVDLSGVPDRSGTVRVALGVGDSYAPAAGTVAEYPIALTASGGEFAVDGQDGDWAAVDNKAVSGGSAFSLKAVKDDDRLILLAEGAGLNAQNEYYIDSDANAATGWSGSGWTNAGIDYKISRNTLYRYDGAGGWTKKAAVYNRVESASDLIYVYLNEIGAASSSPLKVAYVSKNALRLPAAGGDMLTVNAVVHQPRESGTYYPRETFEPLNNPYMGWVAWSLDSRKPTGEAYAQPHSLVYAGITWRELEPVKGQFDWDAIEDKYQFDYWTGLGKRINLRIVLDLPGAEPHKDIPDWLYDELVSAETESGAGKTYDSAGIGKGFAPNYASTALISEHERLIEAVAERYDNDPRIAFVQIGSLGHWGEFHNYPEGDAGAFPKLSVSDQYVRHYIDNFRHKLLGMRKPFPIAAANGLGLFNDVIGDKGSTQSWLSWVTDGWSDIGLYVDEGQDPAETQAASSMPDFWKTNFSGGEFTSGNPLLSINDETFMNTLEQLRASHTSWIGPSSPADYAVGSGGVTRDVQENMDTLLTTMGYRFTLQSAKHEAATDPGTTVQVQTKWLNRGVAPFYQDWPVALALASASGNVIASTVTQATDTDIRTWLPGEQTASLPLNVPSTLPNGTYKLLVGILDPDTNAPGVQLAIKGKRADGWYALDTLRVGPEPSYVPPVTAGGDNGVQQVGALPAPSANGTVDVKLEAGKREARLPLSSLLTAGAPLGLHGEAFDLNVPAEALKGLVPDTGPLPAGTELVFGWTKLDPAQATGPAASGGRYAAAGEAVELTLSLKLPNGTLQPATSFAAPLRLTLRLSADADPALAGIYYLPTAGAPEYVGGMAQDGNITAEISHFSGYAALTSERTFGDVPSGHWARRAIQVLAAHGVASGTGKDAFEPNRGLTRAEFVSMLARALGLKAPASPSATFADVAAGSAYADAIYAAVEAGIVAGKGGGTFAPGGALTREEAAVMLDRAAKAAGATATLDAFDDGGAVSAWAEEAVGRLVGSGVLQGTGNRKLQPQGGVTRAQMAAMLVRWLGWDDKA